MNTLLEQEYLNKIKECKENAKRYYDGGDYEKASEDYLRCSNYCEMFVKKTEDETKKKEYYDAFEKFVDASVKLKKMKTVGVSETKKEHEGGEERAGFESMEYTIFYGLPSTGKILMAAAVAKNIDATSFDVKVSQILSKYYGESPAELDGSGSKTSELQEGVLGL